jgi:hypothetical protein
VLPASHLIELTFTTPNDPGRTVREVGVLQFKIDEAGRGTPLAGLPVPVKENVFLVGLSNVPRDIEANTDLGPSGASGTRLSPFGRRSAC